MEAIRIRFPVIQNYSGADIYFQRLAKGLVSSDCKADLRFYPHFMEIIPYQALYPFLPRHHPCDIIHTKAEYGWLFAEPGKKLVVSLQLCVFDPVYGGHKRLVTRLYHEMKVRKNIARSFELADRVVVISRFLALQAQQIFGRKDIRTIYNGVDVESFSPAPSRPQGSDHPVRLLFVGNMTVRKGFPLLPTIMNKLGEGYKLEYTTGLRTGSGKPLHPRMRPIGCLRGQNLVDAYRRCDILLFPSRLEGFGYPVAEAMACGKPVVCTNYSSLPELIDEGLGGYLCPPDDVDAFADRIRHLGQNPELRLRMGAYNRDKAVQKFSLAQCVQQYRMLYEELV